MESCVLIFPRTLLQRRDGRQNNATAAAFLSTGPCYGADCNLESCFSNSFVSVRMALYGRPRCHLRSHCSFEIRKSGGTLGGKGIATAGLILGYIALVLGIMGIPLLVSMIQSDRERLQRLSTERKEIASDDGKMS